MRFGLVIIVLTLLISSCKKEEIIFDSDVSETYELTSILSFDGKKCVYDASTKTLKYSINQEGLAHFSPYTVFKEYSQVKFNNQVLVNNDKNKLQGYKLNVEYNVEITTKNEVSKFKFVFINLPTVNIIVADEIPNEPHILGKMVVNYPEATRNSLESYIGVEIRGKYSAGLRKKSYGIKPLGSKNIKNVVKKSFFEEMKPNNKWSLDGMYADASKLRNQVSFDLWNTISDVTIKAQYVEVYINTKSMGLYRFGENYTPGFLELTNEARLYTGVDNTAVTKFEELPPKKPRSALWKEWKQIYPNPSQEIEWEAFYQLSKLVVESSDQDFEDEINDYLDLDNIIDYYLFINLCYGYDNVGKNWMFYKENAASQFNILLWDADATWGRKHNGEELGFDLIVSNQLFTRLLEQNPNNFKQKLKLRWDELRSNQYHEEALFLRFQEHFEQLRAFKIINYENRIWNTTVNLDNEEAYIQDWIQNRLIFLDGYYNRL